MRPGSWQAEGRLVEPLLMGINILPPHTSALSRFTPLLIVFLSPRQNPHPHSPYSRHQLQVPFKLLWEKN